MLKLYDKTHTFVAWINQYRDRKIESQVSSGDKSMSFVLLEDVEIYTEYYIRDENDEYVVKEIDQETNTYPTIYCALNLEELEGKAWKTFTVTNVTIAEAARTAIAGTGWIVSSSNVTKRRNAGIIKKSALNVLEDLKTAFMCEIVYDTLNKTISFYEERGSDRGVYFRTGLNLTKLSKKSLTYDYYTRIIPYGADGLDITEVNNGVEYVENLQYSTKVRTYIWEDTNYTDATALKEDAEAKLADMSKPTVSYSANVIDLAELSEDYGLLDFGIGDTIYLVDKETGTKEKQRIVKMTEYPEAPENNTCELSNTSLTWEEMQAALQAAAAIVDAVVSSDGQYTGTISVSDILHFSDGVVDDTDGTTLAQYIQATDGTIGLISANIGTITTNYLRADQAALTYATITNLNAATGRIQTLETNSITSEYADLHYATIDNLTAATGRISALEANSLTAEYANLHYADITLSNVETESVKNLLVSNGIIKNATIVDGHVTGVLDAVTVNASDIVAGTLSVDRLLLRGSTSGIVYALNNFGQLVSQEVDTLDGYILTPRTITADRIVAGAITANEINTSDLYTNFLLTNFLAAAQAQISSLSAITANIGTVTAGILKSSDYAYTSGNYSTAGMIIDLNNKIIQTPHFAVTSAGNLYANSGAIGGWSIGTVSIYREVTGSDGATYRPQLYAPENTTTANGVFSVLKTLNGTTTYPFAIYYDGKIKAEYATIGGFLLNDNQMSLEINNKLAFLVEEDIFHASAYDANGNEVAYIYMDRYGTGSTGRVQLFGDGDVSLWTNGSIRFINASTYDSPMVFNISTGKMQISGGLIAGGGVGTNRRTSYDSSSFGMWATTGGSISLRHDGGTGHGIIGWFYNSESSWSSQIMQSASGVLEAVGYFKMRTYANTTRRVAIGTAETDGQRIGYIWCDPSTVGRVQISGQWGTAGTTYSSRYITTTSSDIRLKKNVKDSSVNALTILNQIQIREFDWIGGQHQAIGMVADEIEKIDSMFVMGGGTDEDGNICYKGIDDFYLDGYLVKGIQELYQTIENLKQEIKALKGEAA